MGTTPARAWVWEEPVGMAVWCLLQLLVVPGEYSRPRDPACPTSACPAVTQGACPYAQ